MFRNHYFFSTILSLDPSNYFLLLSFKVTYLSLDKYVCKWVENDWQTNVHQISINKTCRSLDIESYYVVNLLQKHQTHGKHTRITVTAITTMMYYCELFR